MKDDFGIEIPKVSDIMELQDILAYKNIYIEKLEAENKELKKCLRWYANIVNYNLNFYNAYCQGSKICNDRGKKALEALKED